MKRSEQRILTTHVGSLIRPRTLLDAAKDRDPAHRGAYERELKGAVADVVSRQARAGIDVVNDGEFGKSGWANYSLERSSGFEPRPDKLYPAVWLGRDRIRFADFMAAEFPRGTVGTPGHACVGPIAYQGHASVRRDIDNLRSAAAATDVEEVFFTAVAPASVGYDAVNEYYPNERDYVFAIAKALREEYLEVHKAGFVLQVDDAVLANMYDEPAALSRVGGVADRGAQSCAGGHTRGSRPLSRLLRQLARAPCRRRSARGHRRSDSQSACRRLFHRSGQCAS
jgi:5-methyltetrahydropteroyltriglutamate--homocysteine methyltransferase